MSKTPEQITTLLIKIRSGDTAAQAELLPLIYDTLRRLAASCIRRERPDHMLQPTALVHERWLRLLCNQRGEWQNRAHFFAIAAHTMRCVLVEHAGARVAGKRGGVRKRVRLTNDCCMRRIIRRN